MRCTEAEYVPRLERFRNAMAAEESVLDYFDELEIHPKHIGTVTDAAARIVQQTSKNMWRCLVSAIKAAIRLFCPWTPGGAVPLI